MMASIQYSKKRSDADIARVRAILDRAQDILSLDDSDALFEEASLFLELEPTPIGLNGISTSRSMDVAQLNKIADELLVRDANDALEQGLVDSVIYRDELIYQMEGNRSNKYF